MMRFPHIWNYSARGLVPLMLLALAGGLGAQEAAPSPQEDAGRLYNPGAVQQRTPTTDLDNDDQPAHMVRVEQQCRDGNQGARLGRNSLGEV